MTQVDPMSYVGERVQNSFFFAHTDYEEVHKLIMSFGNKRTTLNNIPIIVLKKVSHVLTPLIVTLFNESATEGIFPEKLKLGRVIPLHKNGPQDLVENFRPITTLSIFSKIFEKLVHKRMTSFIMKYNLLSDNQFGFTAGKSTSDAILKFLDNAYDSLNNNNYLLTIYLDFSRAFDTISHDILLRKLEHYGFRNEIHSWFKSFLCNRKQFVSIGETESDIIETTLGVPQGSTLGPLAFLIYINDMHNCLPNMKIIHFADDSTMFMHYKKNNDCSSTVNDDLMALDSWLSANRLFLNIKKKTNI